MPKTLYFPIFGIFFCIIGFFAEINYIISSAIKKVPISIENERADRIFKKYIDNNHCINRDKNNNKKFTEIISYLTKNIPPSEYQYKIFIINSKEINAYSFIGGYIFVTTGLIKFADNAEELLGVISHEIAHINKRHAIESIIKNGGIYSLIKIFLNDYPVLFSEMISGGANIITLSFSQENEREADILATEYLVNAKIDPNYFANFFNKLEEIERGSKLDKIFFLRSHPLSKDRANYVIKHFNQLNNPRFARLPINYLEFKNSFK